MTERCVALNKRKARAMIAAPHLRQTPSPHKTHPVQVVEPLPPRRHASHVRLLVDPRGDDFAVEIVEAVVVFARF